jgi:hypothetical protein
MTQKDYILRMFEEIGRALAQILYQRQIKDYEAAHALVDEQLKQALGMGRGFIRSISDETLLSMLTAMGTLNVDKCWLVATLFKAEGEIYEDQQNENDRYYSYLKACNLFLEALYDQHGQKNIEQVVEIEELLGKLEVYELPLRTRQLLFWYFEYTDRYSKAEDMLFDILETTTAEQTQHIEEVEEIVEKGEAFYVRLLRKNDEDLIAGNLSREEIKKSLARLHTFYPG